jgi:hypothetical protein
MTRTIGSAMVVAAIMAAGCTMEDVSSRARQSIAESGQQEAQEPTFSTQATANILIFGDQFTAINNIRTRLATLGHTVTVRDDFGLPDTLAEMAQFNTIWHLGRTASIPEAKQPLLAAYLAAGGGLHLTGENSASDTMNDSITAFVRSVVNNGSGITVGRQGLITGIYGGNYFAVNENAAGGVANSPNTVRVLELVGAGAIGGMSLSSPNVLVTGGYNGDKVVGAIWTSNDLTTGEGKLSLIMDSDWLARLAGSNDNAKLIQNLQDQLTGTPFINQPPVAQAVLPAGQILDCNDGSNNAREEVPVRLDGSGSIDPDGGPQALTYTWYENGEVLGTGATPTVNLTVGPHLIVLAVNDGEFESFATVDVLITCNIACEPGGSLFTRCHPGCPCDHGEGDCDTEADCLPGLVCLHDAGFAFGYVDDEVDVCSNKCPTLGVGAWNYCSPDCPCDIGQGDCESDLDCLPGLQCVSDIGPAFGFQREVDMCEPR